MKKKEKELKVIIEVEGGLVSAVTTDGPARVLIADWDGIKEDPEHISSKLGYWEPDNQGKEAFSRILKSIRKQRKEIIADAKKIRSNY